MATRLAKMEKRDNDMVVVTWEQLNGDASPPGDDGAPVTIGNCDGLTVQAVGSFDTTGVITMQGSNDGTNWGTIGSGTLTASNPFRTIAERPLFIRPVVTTGDADVDLDVIMVGSRRGT